MDKTMTQTDMLTQRIQDLTHPDSSTRRQAAEALSGADERALYPLIRALQDANSGVQDAAMRSLISIGGEVTAYMALPLLRESAYLRNTAMIILKQIGAPSVPLLRPLLRDKDDDIRKFAVDLISDIGRCGYPRDIALLLESDPNPNVRAAAARAIGRLGYDQARARLLSALKDDEWVCISALESLAALRDETTAEQIEALLNSSSEAVRYTAIEALGSIRAESSKAALVDRLPKAGGLEKTAIVKGLVQIGVTPTLTEEPDVLAVLLELLMNGDWDDKLAALKGLGGLGDPAALPPIIDIAGSLDPSEPENEDRLLFLKDALRGFGCEKLMNAALDDPAAKYRGKVIVIEMLAELRCEEAVPTLVRLMEGNLREVRRASALALGEMPVEGSMQTLRESIEDRDGHVRRAAVAALGRIGDKASFGQILGYLGAERYRDVLEEMVKALLAIDANTLFSNLRELSAEVKETIGRYAADEDILLSLSNDADRPVKLAALCGLGSVRSERVVKRLAVALHEDDPETRKCAVISLGRLDCCHEAVRAAIHDADLWVRLSAVNALGDSGKKEMLDALIPALADPEHPVAFAAIDAVAKIGGNEATAELVRLKSHQDAAVRERALRALEKTA